MIASRLICAGNVPRKGEVRNKYGIIWELDPAHDKDKQWAIVKAVMNLWVSQKAGDFLTS
jgi:hypothetical protein